jgi:hypothetical protein
MAYFFRNSNGMCNQNNGTKAGYILIVTMLILAASTILVTGLIYRASGAVPLARFAIAQERAKLLAFSGPDIVRALLTVRPEKEEKDAKKETQKVSDPELKKLFTQFLPMLNRWTTFQLKEPIDGIDGTITIYLSSEDGKVNLNTAYDFEKKAFFQNQQKGPAAPTSPNAPMDQKGLVQLICQRIEKQKKISNLFEAIEKFFKKLDGPLEDISQLLLIPELEKMKNELYPSQKSSSLLFLSDLFTVCGTQKKIQPWVFSAGIAATFDCKKAVAANPQEEQKAVQGWLKNFKKNVGDWKKEWTPLLKPVYQKELQSLPKGIDSLFDTSCVPHLFSVVSIGTFGEISCSVLAIIELTEHKENNRVSYESAIKKWYIL